MCVYYFFVAVFKKLSSAVTMLGDCGAGALMLGSKPASSTDLMVLAPNAAILVPFCLYFGKFSNKLFTPPGVKKQITS